MVRRPTYVLRIVEDNSTVFHEYLLMFQVR